MLTNKINFRNPLSIIGGDILPEGGFGAVLARAGVGKTALLIQIALNSMLNNKNILHISLNDSVDKAGLWYEEVFRNIANQNNVKQADRLWESVLPRRFIMAFDTGGFSLPRLKERLDSLTEQNIFIPQTLLIDGFSFDKNTRKPLEDLKAYAKSKRVNIWFAMRTHRHEVPGPDGIPAPLFHVSDLFEVAILLQPEEQKIRVIALKGEVGGSNRPPLLLDPSTMLIKNDE